MNVVIIKTLTLEAAQTLRDLIEDGSVTRLAESLSGKLADPVIGDGDEEDLNLALRCAILKPIE